MNSRSNFKLSVDKHSLLLKHSICNEHSFDCINSKILDIEYKYQTRLISEVIHVKLNIKTINI